MNSEEFAKIFNEIVDHSEKVLIKKAEEYASDTDRLHNFNVAAATLGEIPQQALGGFMCKHTVSIYDMIRDPENTHSLELWDEKIGDHINYLILLKAVVVEARKKLPLTAVHLIDPDFIQKDS